MEKTGSIDMLLSFEDAGRVIDVMPAGDHDGVVRP
jgi:hypothetical protein